MSNLKNLNENEFSDEVLNSELPVIVDFGLNGVHLAKC